MAVTLEEVLDKIATTLITNGVVDPTTIRDNQKTIRDGIIQVARNNSEKLLLFESDVKANEEDMTSMDLDGDGQLTSLSAIVDGLSVDGFNISQIAINSLSGGTTDGTYTSVYLYCFSAEVDINITPLIQGDGNPFNVSQFINLIQDTSIIDPDQAHEFLDTNIYELLPTGKTRQERIDDLFAEVETLKAPETPDFTGNTDLVTGDIDAEPDYEANNDISYAQEYEDGIEEEEAFITRLNIDANSTNEGKTIESLRNRLNEYLLDIDQVIEAEIDDSRPEYIKKSDGYLKIRNLNQGIIIRKQEGDDIGIEQEITIEDVDHPHDGMTGPSYLQDGFTISIWARFLDKTSKGTLFNYGNPLRSKDPRGFMLETYVLNKDDIAPVSGATWGTLAADNIELFSNSDSERFIRLVVYDHLPHPTGSPVRRLYDSSKGITGFSKTSQTVPEFGMSGTTGWVEGDEIGLLTHTRVPINFDEWYFIVANFNPLIDDVISSPPTGYETDPNYWNGNVKADGMFHHYSGLGNKCKVEIISKSDLNRARGYKV
tara:strand:+ start:822 stop:2450 length:1629 start_codon:yes stop_codon:yes gene_type:complete